MEFKKAIKHRITIEPSANNGFFVNVGCTGPFVYIDKKELIADLEAYLNNPDQYEKECYPTEPVCREEQPDEAQQLGSGANIMSNRR